MGEALFDLEQVLKSKQEKLTPQEDSILESCKSKAVRDFTYSAVAGGTVAWTATWKLNKLFRINLAFGTAAVFGLWRFGRSLDSCADYILGLKGSRMQKELANILVTKFQNDPSKMQLISKHFYTEKIYDDSTSDRPKLRWRYRNSFSDNVVNGQRTHDYDFSDSSLGDSHDDSNNISQGDSKEASDSTRANLDTKRIFDSTTMDNGRARRGMLSPLPSSYVNGEGLVKHLSPIEQINPVLDTKEEADPLDYLFAYSAPVEENHHSSTPNKPTGIHNRGHKRSHRRRRMRHHEELSNSEV